MARRTVLEPEVRDVVDRLLVPLFLRCRSVKALADLLNTELVGEHDRVIYKNRLRALLSDDPGQGVNDATFAAVRAAAERVVKRPDPAAEATTSFTATLRERALELGDRGDLGAVARELEVPAAVVRAALADAGLRPAQWRITPVAAARGRASRHAPDWSYQDDAVRSCLDALARGDRRKVGLVLPTGGGKTRVAHRVALRVLAEGGPDARVVWITHRRTLRRQAHKDLQRMVSAGLPSLPPNAAALAARIEFRMIGELERALEPTPVVPSLVIVDEAHHAAAKSYKPLFNTSYPLRALFLTATPVRTDRELIGIDEVAFTLSYRELYERGVIVLPQFEEFDVEDFDWRPEALAELADLVVDRADEEYVKTLVIAPTIARVEQFYDALRDALARRPSHILGLDDVDFVHSRDTSRSGEVPDEVIDAFVARERGILVSADMLLEGFDDPSVNAVVMTYPSESLITLMQASGRCVRYHPGKKAAYVLQAKSTSIAYHFDHRWLYQEISDRLRPALCDVDYSDAVDLRSKLAHELDLHRVTSEVRYRILAEFDSVRLGDRCRLLLTGLPYWGEVTDFAVKSDWDAVLETSTTGERFRSIFNEYCAFDAPAASDVQSALLQRNGVPRSTAPGSAWRTFHAMLIAMSAARREIEGEGPIGGPRPYQPYGATTWLRYVTFVHKPVVPQELEQFLGPCTNREQLLVAYSAAADRYAAAVRVPLPLGAYIGFILERSHSEWLREQRVLLIERLGAVSAERQHAEISAWRTGLTVCPLPLLLVERIEFVLPEALLGNNFLDLRGTVRAGTAGSGTPVVE